MTTQYTPVLRLALPVEGELIGAWGTVVNENITSMIEEAITGLATVNTWTTNSHTLTVADGTTSEARSAMLVLTDTGTALTGAATVVCPTSTKLYVVKNSCGQSATIKTAAGTGVAIPNGETYIVFCDGVNVVQAITGLTLPSGTANGVGYLNGSKVLTSSTSFTFDGTNLVIATTGAVQLPAGTTAERPATPVEGMFRRNTETASFEGYDGSTWTGVGGASGGGGNPFVYENDQTVTTDYTITSSKNAMSTGPITIDSGVTVTVPTGGRWVVI